MTESSALVRDATCTACGCLCDDLTLSVRDGRIVAAERACEKGRQWFLADNQHAGLVAASVDGIAVSDDEAVRRAGEILSQAKAPVILGLSQTSTESVAAALVIADRIGAAVEVNGGSDALQKLLAIQRVGRVSATLGEVKNRADVVVFWGVDPVVTHPRHWERYSVEPRGRFVPEGRAGRTVVVLDAERTASAERADLFVKLAPDAQFEALWTLRARLKGAILDPARVERATGLDLSTLDKLLHRLKSARYGAFFFGTELGGAPGGSASVEAALTFVRDLNAHTRFVALSLGAPGNAAGAEAVLTWQSGCSGGVEFARGYPRSLGRETSAVAMLERGEADAALIVSEDAGPFLSDAARKQLALIRRIVIAPGATAMPQAATVALCSATPGIDAAGTVMRTDGVVLPLRPALPARFRSDRQWLEAIAESLNSISRS